MLVVGDTPSSVSKSIALGTSGFTDAFANLKPHAVILLGDRYELLCAAIPALISNIPPSIFTVVSLRKALLTILFDMLLLSFLVTILLPQMIIEGVLYS